MASVKWDRWRLVAAVRPVRRRRAAISTHRSGRPAATSPRSKVRIRTMRPTPQRRRRRQLRRPAQAGRSAISPSRHPPIPLCRAAPLGRSIAVAEAILPAPELGSSAPPILICRAPVPAALPPGRRAWATARAVVAAPARAQARVSQARAVALAADQQPAPARALAELVRGPATEAAQVTATSQAAVRAAALARGRVAEAAQAAATLQAAGVVSIADPALASAAALAPAAAVAPVVVVAPAVAADQVAAQATRPDPAEAARAAASLPHRAR